MHATNDVLISVETNACGDIAGDKNSTTLMHIYLEFCHVIPDEPHWMLKVMDVPIQEISQPAYSCALYSSIGCYCLTFDTCKLRAALYECSIRVVCVK